MSDTLAWLLLVLLAGGVLGGFAAFLSQPASIPGAADREAPAPWYSYIAMGAVAAGCVPLFLSLLKSGLITQILNSPAGGAILENYLILLGLAIVAGFSSRQFLKTIADQLIRRIEQTQREAYRATETAADAKEIATEVALEIEGAEGKEAELPEAAAKTLPRVPAASPDPGAPSEPDSAAPEEPDAAAGEAPGVVAAAASSLSANERRVLKSLTLMSRRTATGIAEDSGIPRMRIGELLDSLAEKGLIIPTVSPVTGGARWQITSRGAAVLAGSRAQALS